MFPQERLPVGLDIIKARQSATRTRTRDHVLGARCLLFNGLIDLSIQDDTFGADGLFGGINVIHGAL